MRVFCLQEVWQDVMRCVSRWELLQAIHSGGPTDAIIFAQPSESPQAHKKRNFFSLRASTPKDSGAFLHSLLPVRGCRLNRKKSRGVWQPLPPILKLHPRSKTERIWRVSTAEGIVRTILLLRGKLQL